MYMLSFVVGKLAAPRVGTSGTLASTTYVITVATSGGALGSTLAGSFASSTHVIGVGPDVMIHAFIRVSSGVIVEATANEIAVLMRVADILNVTEKLPVGACDGTY